MPALISDPAAGLPPLPDIFARPYPQPVLQYQGAEALVYRTSFPIANRPSPPSSNVSLAAIVDPHSTSTAALRTHPAFLKHRPRKPYRHPILDAKLTRHRILSEARVLSKLRREDVSVPALYALDWEAGWMMGEWVEGPGTVRAVLEDVLPGWVADVEAGEEEDEGGREQRRRGEEARKRLVALMRKIGVNVGRMHEVGVVHGDLTTSNLMLRPVKRAPDAPHTNGATNTAESSMAAPHETSLSGDVVIIDFGLAAVSTQDEDRAVDLYVLERAFGSTHPRTEGLFEELLKAYGQSYKGAKVTLKRLEEVRMRGRKKIMIG